MPLIVHCSELQPSMRLAEAFMWQGRVMLPGGKILTMSDVDVLHRKYPDVSLKIGDPVLDAIVPFEDDSKDREVAETAQSQIAASMSEIQDRFNGRTATQQLNFRAMRDTAATVIGYLNANPVTAALLKRTGGSGNYLAEHSGAVFYLSIILGTAVRDYVMRERLRQTSASSLSTSVAMDLLALGLGAMFMDIGMYPLQKVFEAGYVLTDEDRKAIREHPMRGADLLPDSLPAGVKMITRTHHENYDGTGYPAATPGANLHVFTRIVRICDAFTAATSERGYARAKSVCRVLWEMRYGPLARHYDPVLMKVFHTLIQPFPIGAKIKLADGRTAVVVRYNKKEPFRPQVIVAFDASGERLPKEKLEGPHVVGEGGGAELKLKAYDGEDLEYIQELPRGDVRVTPAEVQSLAASRMHWEDVLAACYP